MTSRRASINPVDILDKLSWGENEDLEFKSGKGGLPRDLWETYSAMANTQGGVILIGVRDDGSVGGLPEVRKVKKQFWDSVNNRQNVSINLLSNSDLQVVECSGHEIIAIRIPRADRRDRPVFVGSNPLTGTYRRNFEGDYHCTEREVRRMLADGSEETADSRILEKFTLSDLDLPSLQQYRNRLASKRPSHPWLDEDDINLLHKLGGWGIDRKSGTEGLTVAGLLMFGKDETIREGIPQYQVDYRERLSEDPEVRWTDRLTQDGTWSGNLYQFYHRVIQKLSTELKLPFALERDLSRKGETLVHEAIREALVNTLIHADYQGQGGLVIEKYPNRFEFSNPGSLLISFEQILRGGVSECRNRALQHMFMMIGVAEKAGSGIDKIRSGWSSQHWRLPVVREWIRPDRVMWMLPMISLIPDASLERLKSVFGNRFSQFKEGEIQALVTADIEGFVDNARLRQLTGLHTADVTKLLQGLVAQQALAQDGQGRWTRYTLPEKDNYLNFRDEDTQSKDYSSRSADDTIHKDSDTVHKDSDTVHKDSDTVHKDSDTVHKEGKSLRSREIPPDRWALLLELAKPAQDSKRLPPKEMENILLSLCEDQWLTRRQLSTLVKRNSDSLRARFLTPMVEHNLLELRYPDKPKRTDQAYRTARTPNPKERNHEDRQDT